MLQLLRESGELRVVCVLDSCSSDQSLEELTLEDDLGRVVDVFSGNIAVRITFILFFFREIRVIVLLSSSSLVALRLSSSIHEIELANITSAK